MGKSKILAIDDSMLIRKVVEKIFLEEAPFKDDIELFTAVDGKDAVEKAKEIKPDLILLDVVLPDKTGYEVCEEIKANAVLADVPLIFITSKTSDDDIAKGFELGAVDYVQKPFRAFELIARVKTHLEIKKAKDNLLAANAQLSVALAENKKLATCDPLTGLYNRRFMQQRFTEEINRISRGQGTFSIIMGDIDKFKSVNDTYGHDIGDLVLTSVAKTMGDACRKTDILSRWGGEEFLLLCTQTDEYTANLLAEKIRISVENLHLKAGDVDFKVTISLGVVEYDLKKTLEQNVGMADKALYVAKESGRNRVIIAKEGM